MNNQERRFQIYLGISKLIIMILPLPVLEYSFNECNIYCNFQRGARVDKMHSSKKVNAYDVEDMVMPLHEYINDPVAHEIIHNGATFQV